MDHFNQILGIVPQPFLADKSKAPTGGVEKDLEGVADLRRLKRACEDFESIFVYTLLKTMRESIPKPEGASQSREIYTSIGDLELARSIAHGRGIGLADLLFEQLKQKVH